VSATGSLLANLSGAAGPTQVVVATDGRLRTYSRAGAADGVLDTTLSSFFASAMTPLSGTVLANFAHTPNVRYDRFTARWILSALDSPCLAADCSSLAPNRVMLAVSNAASNGTISGSTVWTFFSFQADATNIATQLSLGVDVNALYVGANILTPAGSLAGTNGYVVQKSSILGAGPIVVTTFANFVAGGTGAGPFSPRGVDNVDPAATEGYFIGVDNATFSTLMLRRVTNPGSATPTVSGNISMTVPTTDSRCTTVWYRRCFSRWRPISRARSVVSVEMCCRQASSSVERGVASSGPFGVDTSRAWHGVACSARWRS